MREILFKAKRTDNGEWVEGDLIQDREERRFAISNDSGLFEAAEYSLCQYTGLTDKNGKRIWENDILRHDNGNYMIVKWNGRCARWDLVLESTMGHRWPVGEWRPLWIDWKHLNGNCT